MDVHHLLHIAGVLRAELAARGDAALGEAERRSRDVTLALYAKPTSEVLVALAAFSFRDLGEQIWGSVLLLCFCMQGFWYGRDVPGFTFQKLFGWS